MRLEDYATLVFDCDGVVLNSNKVKTEAFRVAALPWGTASAEELVSYHVANGGVSRYQKFAYFLDHILPKHHPDASPGRDGPDLQALLESYAYAVQEGLMNCDIADGLNELRTATAGAQWIIASGGDQDELRKIFNARGIAEYFDGGIFGSPDDKDTILAREKSVGRLFFPALFIGDSRYDHFAAQKAGLDFTFLYGWTEVSDWKSYVASNSIFAASNLRELLSVNTRLSVSKENG